MINRLAGFLAIFAFATVCLIGALDGLPVNTVLIRAVGALFLFYLLGWAIGAVGHRVLLEHFDEKRQAAETAATPTEAKEPDTATESESFTPSTRDRSTGPLQG